MIDCKDLRVGNWIRFNNHTYVQVFEINSDDNTCNGLDLNNDDFHEPILLTPELLINCGFVKGETDMVNSKDSYSIQIGNTCSLYFTEGDWYITLEWVNHTHEHLFWGQPKYLHQLQNLYYALSGEELEIDLK